MNEQAAHALRLHLTAVHHYEKIKAAEKVIKHMKGFMVLLVYQKNNHLITDKGVQYAYEGCKFID